MDAVFANFDKDVNGTISPSELRAAMAEVCLRNEGWRWDGGRVRVVVVRW